MANWKPLVCFFRFSVSLEPFFTQFRMLPSFSQALASIKRLLGHEIFHKHSASIKSWPKFFHESSVTFDIVSKTSYAWGISYIFGMTKCAIFVILRHPVYFHLSKLCMDFFIQLTLHFEIILLSVLWKILNHSFRIQGV